MVLDKGQLVEFDTPQNLLQNDNSLFAKLVDQTGTQTAQYLRDIAFGRAKLFDNHLSHSKTKTTKESKRSPAKKKSKKRKNKTTNDENKRNIDRHNNKNNDSEQTMIEMKGRDETKISPSNPQ
jgi:ABC-type proline/glycine betaine transport system ATPase subunit